MTDLIKRLGASCYLAFEVGTNDYSAAQETIDRIEGLERDYKEACNEAADCYTKQCVAEAKLTKAVEALNMVDLSIMENTNETEWRLWGEGAVSDIRKVLAELEGGE